MPPRIEMHELQSRFHLPLGDAAKQLGVSLTYMKKLCRSYSITRWPFRKVRAAERKTLRATELQMGKSYSSRLRQLDLLCDQTLAGSAEVLDLATSGGISVASLGLPHGAPVVAARVDPLPRTNPAQVSIR